MRPAQTAIITFNAVLCGAASSTSSAVSGGSPLLIATLGLISAVVAAVVTRVFMK